MIKSISNWYWSMLFLVIFLSSCKEKVITTHYDSGQKHEVYQYTGDSLKNGAYTRFSPEGIQLETSNYLEGKLHGKRTIFNVEGKKEIEEFYTEGVLDGILYEYYPTGEIKMESPYKNNVLTGLVKVYYPSGKLKEEVQFEDNVEEGPFKEYHENGNLMWEGTYRNGSNEFGLLKKYDEQGELIQKMMCDERAICTTTWTKDGSHLKKNKS